MTILATPIRRLPASHAFVVPVVRELPQPRGLAASAAW
jgi:hypothetical protein